MTPSKELIIKALDTRFESQDQKAQSAKTIRSYLYLLLSTLWKREEDFNGKRPFGNSGWQFAVYNVLITHGFIEGTLDEDGYIANFNDKEASDFVEHLIYFMCFNEVRIS